MDDKRDECCPCDRSSCDSRSEGSPSRIPANFNPGFLDNPHRTEQDLPSHWSTRKQLYCRTRYNLAIDGNGRVYGAPEAYNRDAILQFKSVRNGDVQIQAVNSEFYLAMNREGNLYGETDPKEEGTVFVESFDRNSGYNNYLSRKYAHFGWYVGIKKSGRPKPGPKTAYGQKAIMFLPRQAAPSGTN